MSTVASGVLCAAVAFAASASITALPFLLRRYARALP
jgi:hypothetical protein